MKFAYYPGCSGKGTSVEYEISTKAVCSALGIYLQELADWSCCGSTPAHATDTLLSAALSARNLSLAAEAMKQSGATKLATPCPSCLANLKTAPPSHGQSGIPQKSRQAPGLALPASWPQG